MNLTLSQQVQALRKCVRYLSPMAQEITGAYPPEAMEEARQNIRKINTFVRKLAPKRKKRK